jgi:hypothetical protein
MARERLAAGHGNPAGWPRPWLAHPTGRRLPVPWISGLAPLILGAWASFDPHRASQAQEQRLCFCCGRRLERLVILGRYSSLPEKNMLSDGPGGHPRCLALAAGACPYLQLQQACDPNVAVAYVYEGPGLGYRPIPASKTLFSSPVVVDPTAQALTYPQLTRLAHHDPLGTATT